MMMLEPLLTPPVEDNRNDLISQLVTQMCKDIIKRGEDTNYPGAYDLLFEVAEQSLIPDEDGEYGVY